MRPSFRLIQISNRFRLFLIVPFSVFILIHSAVILFLQSFGKVLESELFRIEERNLNNRNRMEWNGMYFGCKMQKKLINNHLLYWRIPIKTVFNLKCEINSHKCLRSRCYCNGYRRILIMICQKTETVHSLDIADSFSTYWYCNFVGN